jgi:DnaJ homolog subfamily C member 3
VELAPDNSEEKQHASKRLQNAQVALKQSKEKNYYKILGISRTATAKEIKAAYRKLALQWYVGTD